MAEVLIHLKVDMKQKTRKEPVQDSPVKDPHPVTHFLQLGLTLPFIKPPKITP